MNGLVMEVNRGQMVVLTDSGEFVRLKYDGVSAIGDSVRCKTAVKPWANFGALPVRRAAAAFASLLLAASVGLGAYGYSQPFGVVNIDVNPSVALTYNWFSRVIAAEALNADGEALLTEIGDLHNVPVTEAADSVIQAVSESGYLAPELANIVFVAVSDKRGDARADALAARLETELPALAKGADTVIITGSTEDYHQVQETHRSPVPEMIQEQLAPKGQAVSDSVRSDKPLKEILENQNRIRAKQHQENTVTDGGKDKSEPTPQPSENKGKQEKPANNSKPKENRKNDKTPASDKKAGPPEEQPVTEPPVPETVTPVPTEPPLPETTEPNDSDTSGNHKDDDKGNSKKDDNRPQ